MDHRDPHAERNPVAGDGVRLVGDVGGTYARFAFLGETARDLRGIQLLRCADYPGIRDAVVDYLGRNALGSISEVCIAVAGPVGQDVIDLTNGDWSFSVDNLTEELGVPVQVINDFTAQALSVDLLGPDELLWFGAPRPTEPGIRSILGPGTGLGVAVQMVNGDIIPSEGGHVGFAPASDQEIDLLRTLLPKFSRVSVERLLSGPGLENIYWANRKLHGGDPSLENEEHPAEHIARLAADGDAIALKSVQDFFDVLAAFAGDVALLAWSTGGVYLSGGVLQALFDFLDVPRFRSRFENKGRFSEFCKTVPLACITHDYPGLLGCAAALQQEGPMAGLSGTTTLR